jgi:hypothetical protein
MTSEVMLMNLEAIAFAADSAATLTQYSDSGVKVITQTGVEKIFVLDENLPMACLIYGTADFSGAPWANVFETFKLRAPSSTQSVTEISQRLLAFLAAARPAEESAKIELPMHIESDAINLYKYIFYTLRRLDSLVEERLIGGGEVKVGRIFSYALSELEQESKYEVTYLAGDIASPQTELAPRRIVGQSTDELVELVQTRLDPFIANFLDAQRFEHLKKFPSNLRGRLREVIIASLVTDWLPPGLNITGIVVAGFGAKNVQPAFEHVEVFGSMGGILKHVRRDHGTPSFRESVIVRSFAQDDAINAFLCGTTESFFRDAYYHSLEMVSKARSDFVLQIGSIQGKIAKEVDTFAGLAEVASLEGLGYAIGRRNEHILRTMTPMLSACSAEPLAQHANRLLNLEILEHELGGEPSVGRPIRLIAMSKGNLQRLEA